MRIGILTFHGADNYGCVLQCMALQNAVKDMLPDADVEIINYVMPGLTEKKLLISKAQCREIKKKFGKKGAAKRVLESIRTMPGRAQRIRKFQNFREKELNLSGAVFSDIDGLAKLSYDVYIVGSDQVFNIGLVKGKEEIFFLEKVPETARKISYAASTGHSIFWESEKEWFRKHLRKLNHISIREKSAQAAIQDFANKKVSVCLDPTMLYRKEYWRTLEKKPKGIGNKKYVFMYGLGYAFCKEQEKQACMLAQAIAKQSGLIVVHSYYGDYRKRFSKDSRHCYYQGPNEFLWLIDHAEYVINCSYHGTVFSVIFEKRFYTYSTGGNSARMQDLVETLGLKHRYLDEPMAIDKLDWNIDWKIIYENWDKERKRSQDYLKEAIEG